MKFLRNLLASIIGVFIAIAIILFLFFVIAGASVMNSEESVVIHDNSVLELDLQLTVKDYAPKDANPLIDALELNDDKLALNKIINAIENAKTDDKIKGISIKTPQVNAGMAQVKAIRNKLEEFKESGKFIYAYNDFYLQKNYYLSSVADSLFINPIGVVEFKGLSSEVLYFKDFQDKYGVKMEVIRHGKYKSAVEPFLANKMSDANREQISSFLNSIWGDMVDDISKSRKITIETVNTLADSLAGRNANLAKDSQLVDATIYEDEYIQKLKTAASEKYKTISIADYIKAGKGKISKTSENKIAVIYAQGEIKYGKGNEEYIGNELINKAIRKAKKDDKVKAIVLRVNSPGGSALASDIILRELELAKKEKPLVVSMGNLAASGGYYIASKADKIYAQPTTITGSIGVFGMIPNLHKVVGNMGINAERVATNNSPSYSLFEPMDKRFETVTQEGVENIYTTFVNHVAEGRKMTVAQVDSIAQGRVWTGKEAKKIGLVDEIGSLHDAIQAAAELADIKSYKIRNYPRYKKDLKDLKLNPFSAKSKEALLKETLGNEAYSLYNNMIQIKDLKGIQARMPYVINIK